MERLKILKPGVFSVQAAADGRRKEFDINNEVVLTRKLPVDFVFIGDSITHYWDLHAFFRQEGGLLLNRGISGDSTEFILRRFEADVIQLRPAYAVLLAGVNDTWVLEKFPWVESAPGQTPDNIVEKITANITAMAGMAAKHKAEPVLCSILPTDMAWSTENRTRNEIIARTNRRLKLFAEEKKLLYADYHSCFTGRDGITLKEGLSDDGIHPHVKGYETMAEILADAFAGRGILLKRIAHT